MTNKITLVTNTSGELEALYLNGSLVIQNNSIPRFELVDTMTNNQPFEFNEVEVSAEWICDQDNYPKKLSDIPAGVYV